jgi:hypothetical protein
MGQKLRLIKNTKSQWGKAVNQKGTHSLSRMGRIGKDDSSKTAYN